MKRVMGLFVIAGIMMGSSTVRAHEEHAATPDGQHVLTGEVVDTFCYLSHGKEGLGKDHADCAKKCIESGLPVAIKVGDQLYLAVMADHNPANATLAQFAGERVTVNGQILEQDGQHLIAVTHVEKAK